LPSLTFSEGIESDELTIAKRWKNVGSSSEADLFLTFRGLGVTHRNWVKVRSPGVQPTSRLYPQLRIWSCTAQTDALCQQRKSPSFVHALAL